MSPAAARRRWVRASAAAAGALALACGVAACGGHESRAELRALQDDPLGRYSPPAGRLVRTDADDERSGGPVFGKPTPATFRRLYAVPATAGGEPALAATVAAAQAAGWSVQTVPGLGATGTKRLPTGDATMSVSLLRTAEQVPGDTPPPVLSLALEHSR